MKKIFGFYTRTPLVLRILVGLAIGILLGLLVKDVAPIAMLGDIFVGALKAIAPVLVFVLHQKSEKDTDRKSYETAQNERGTGVKAKNFFHNKAP